MATRKAFRTRWVWIVLVAVLFAAVQALARTEGSAGGRCLQSLTVAGPADRAETAWVTLGWPAAFATITREGCAAAAPTRVEWHGLGALAEILILAGLAAVVLWMTRDRKSSPDNASPDGQHD